MDGKEKRYIFPSTLSNQRRWMGLPIDEFCVYVPLAAATVFSSLFIYGPILAVAIITVKRLKRGKGSSYLLNLVYWFLPKSVADFFIRSLPASHLRYWIS
ncbi:type IV conjugative transfer system protein TraL [Morganella morganii]|uniref:Protein TraL n=2 Tax=Morganella morganii TaxID=582 RepID=A0A6B8DIU3_MORMO|nr:type IV conjugative transfer system protein TraL [Morganella morganii]MBS9572180.1 type IV conjugative transfer system protein TraL [Morganella morganii subsp. morganii]HBT7313179.1 type IV conjugative transfer system protein TraL [Klebsiella pneumoniae]EGT3611237.1 type IV conjugative transfer system protein TraL [Morganella morganii]EKW8501114.1 type IV conjugative transfer system protein TraL [Morganella morganii]ELB1544655.1 type IV conjugative transfer system protein TraL [Morganella m